MANSNFSPSAFQEMFAPEFWDLNYAKNEYDLKPPSERVKNCCLHFLIARNQPDNIILPYIDNQKKKSFQKLTAKDAKFKNCTPLMVAAMKANLAVVNALLKAFKDVSKKVLNDELKAQDQYGWTALHFARLTSPQIFQALVSAGADESLCNYAGGTAEDLDLWVGRKSVKDSMAKTRIDIPGISHQLLSELSTEELKEKLGLTLYTDLCLHTQEHWQTLWSQNLESDDVIAINQSFRDLYFSRHYPELILKPFKELQEDPDSRHLGLFASQEIKQFDFVCELSGKISSHHKLYPNFAAAFSDPDDAYGCGDVTTKEVGGRWRWMNTGWPNVILQQVKRVQGISMNVFFAGKPIMPNEQLLWNYGPVRPLVWNKYKLFNREDMREWFKGGLFPRLDEFDQGSQKKKNLTNLFQMELINTRIAYVLDNPAAFLDLILSKNIRLLGEWLLFINSDSLLAQTWREERDSQHRSAMAALCARLIDFFEKLDLKPESSQEIRAWLIDQIGHLTVMQIIKAIDDIVLYQEELTLEKWNELKMQFQKTLSHYDWLKDDQFVLGLRRRAAAKEKDYEEGALGVKKLEMELRFLRLKNYTEQSEEVIMRRLILEKRKSKALSH